MSTLNEIEAAVSQLPADELQQFRRWFAEFDAERWISSSSMTYVPASWTSLLTRPLIKIGLGGARRYEASGNTQLLGLLQQVARVDSRRGG